MYILVYPAVGKAAFGQIEVLDTVTEHDMVKSADERVKILRFGPSWYEELRYVGDKPTDPKSFVWKSLKRLRGDVLDVGKRIRREGEEA